MFLFWYYALLYLHVYYIKDENEVPEDDQSTAIISTVKSRGARPSVPIDDEELITTSNCVSRLQKVSLLVA